MKLHSFTSFSCIIRKIIFSLQKIPIIVYKSNVFAKKCKKLFTKQYIYSIIADCVRFGRKKETIHKIYERIGDINEKEFV